MEWLIIIFIVGLLLLFLRVKTPHCMLKIGQQAPSFNLPDQTGRLYTLAEFSGKWLVLYFYPKDDTPGCTAQACKFRDNLHEITKMGADVVGISVDNIENHKKFAKKYNLLFPLLADKDAKVANNYHSLLNLGVIKIAKRNTFLIDAQGKIAKIYLSVKPTDNTTEIIADLKKMHTI